MQKSAAEVMAVVRLYDEWTRGAGVTAGVAVRLPGERIASVPDVTAAYARALREAGLDPSALIVARQVHGGVTRAVGASDAVPGIEERGLVIHPSLVCDGLLTVTPGVTVGVITADCLPVLLRDAAGTAVAAAHAGWRGLAAGILPSAIGAFAAEAQAPPSTLRAHIGPCICQACFETGPEVAAAFAEKLGDEARRYAVPGTGDRIYIDLRGLAALILRRAGVPEAHITQSPDCTCCMPDVYWSHRGHGLQRGNQLSLIALR